MTNNRTLDQFFTNPEVAAQCAAIAKRYIKPRTIVEPSAGCGALVDAAKKSFPKTTIRAYDLDPKRSDIIRSNFLTEPIQHADLVFANPPFGKRAALAVGFFNRSAKMADTLAFIVPVQFRKWSVQSKLNKDFRLVSDTLLPEAAFIFNGKPYKVRCCFQVWKRGSKGKNLRVRTAPAITHPDFTMRQYNNTAPALKVFETRFDFAVPRQGYADYSRRETNAAKCERTTQWILFCARTAKTLSRLRRLDFGKLAMRNTSTPGFGKADVVSFYQEVSQ